MLATEPIPSPSRTPDADADELLACVAELGPRFAARAAAADETDAFAAADIAELKASPLLAAGVPAELGGGGAAPAELMGLLRGLAGHAPATALAFAMHTHLVATAAWRRRRLGAPTEGLLRRVATERLLLLSTGGGDWLASSGSARSVAGGYRIDARKTFVSAAPAGDLLLTSALLADAGEPTIVHVALPMRAPGVTVVESWRALGMRATGSHDVVLADVFVPEAAASIRRPAGAWHPAMHAVAMLALPLIYAVYVGVADAARDLAVRLLSGRRASPGIRDRVGEMELQLMQARLAFAELAAAAGSDAPGLATTARVLSARTLAARAVLATVEAAMEAVGGSAFARDRGLERLFRDAQGARFHPMPEHAARELAAEAALGV